MDAVVLRNVVKEFRGPDRHTFRAVDRLDLTARSGEVLGVLGSNGAGKTTTIKMIAGLIIPDQGEIHVQGLDLRKQRREAVRHLGAVLEGNRNIYWDLTVWENLEYWGALKQVPRREILTFAAAALAIWTTSVQIQFRPTEIAVILPLTVTGVYGFGLALAALTLLFKRTHQLMNIFQLFFLFFTGSLIPLEQLHWAIRLFGELLPLTAGIQALRAVGLHGAGFAILAPHLGKIAVTSAVWLIGGVAVYSLADRWARRQGSIGQF